MEYSLELKIPKERVAVLIGKNGETKKELEDYTQAKIDIDSKEGDVKITGLDSLKMYSAKEVIRAIGRGFNPEIAKLLFKQDYILEIISLLDYVKHKGHFERIKGRVIGANGKSRETIENLTLTYISVYGKTIGILGRAEDVIISKKAVENLLLGSPHANVYKWLEKNRRNMKEKEALNW
ncbi:KH domain-containing protein [Candidatus Woesearchaeota archaeon]|nr:KH domain-containing protein [Candidatus Woesearchaeota archaeon]